MAFRHELGSRGEKLAAEFLEEKGYRILHKNWRHRHLEVDLIAEDDFFVLIVEVKYRTTGRHGRPEEFVNYSKRNNMINAAEAFCEMTDCEKEIRFDIVAITAEPQLKIEHIEEAFHAY